MATKKDLRKIFTGAHVWLRKDTCGQNNCGTPLAVKPQISTDIYPQPTWHPGDLNKSLSDMSDNFMGNNPRLFVWSEQTKTRIEGS